jgi:hypothetical protein
MISLPPRTDPTFGGAVLLLIASWKYPGQESQRGL